MDDLAAFMDPALRLPIGGHEYEIHCSAWQGLHLHRMFGDPTRILDDTAERAEILQMLGDTYQQMVDHGIGWPRIAHAGRTALFWFGISPDAGRRYWESGGDAAPGNPLPPSPSQSAMGERLRQIFRKGPQGDRLLLTTASRPSQSASAPESAEEPSPADPAPMALTTPAAARTSKRTASATGSTPNRSSSPGRQTTRGCMSSSAGRTSNSTSPTAASTANPASSANARGGGSNSASPTSLPLPPHDSTAHSAERNPDGA